MTFTPLNDRILVKRTDSAETSPGGIIIPDNAKEKPLEALVIAVGAGRLLENGSRGELSVAIGDQVIYGKFGGADIEVEGDEVKILREGEILAKVVD